MATDIIKQLQFAANPSATIAGVTVDKESPWCNTFYGTAEALIATGLITANQLPGLPGMPKVSTTFYDGVLCEVRSGRVPRDPGFMHISRPTKGKRVTVKIGITADEVAKRRAVYKAQREAAEIQRKGDRAKQAATAQVAMSAAEYLEVACDLVNMIWRVGRTEGRGGAPDSFPFELDDGGALALQIALQEVMRVFGESPLQAVTSERRNLLRARNDYAFQTFLRAQCIPANADCRTQRQ